MYFTESGRRDKMNIRYNDRTDLLYIRFDSRNQKVVNKRVSDNIVLDIGKGEKVVGIEILDASKCLDLQKLLPIDYDIPKRVAV